MEDDREMVLMVAAGCVVDKDGDGEDEDEGEDEQRNWNNELFFGSISGFCSRFRISDLELGFERGLGFEEKRNLLKGD